MTFYTTREGDMLDAICVEFYGTASVVEKVLDVNRGLAELGASISSK